MDVTDFLTTSFWCLHSKRNCDNPGSLYPSITDTENTALSAVVSVPPAATTMPGRRTWYAWNCCPRLQKQGPDSVHSWLVAVACAMSSFFALAGWRSLGFLFVAIQETFQVNRTEGSWPIVVLGALGYMTGFITGPLAQRFGGRPVISLGAAISSIGLMSSFFATTIGFLTFSLGVLHAIGTGMVFIVAPHHRQRALRQELGPSNGPQLRRRNCGPFCIS
ncbi:hypothetical protein MRX96_008561 [Rhipicephalus microplus]